MDESLKSIRTIHQILIVVSAAIVIFALSIKSEESPYERSRRIIREMESQARTIALLHYAFIPKKDKRALIEANSDLTDIFTQVPWAGPNDIKITGNTLVTDSMKVFQLLNENYEFDFSRAFDCSNIADGYS